MRYTVLAYRALPVGTEADSDDRPPGSIMRDARRKAKRSPRLVAPQCWTNERERELVVAGRCCWPWRHRRTPARHRRGGIAL